MRLMLLSSYLGAILLLGSCSTGSDGGLTPRTAISNDSYGITPSASPPQTLAKPTDFSALSPAPGWLPVTPSRTEAEDSNCWQLLWDGNLESYGSLLKIAEGPLHSLWFLHENALGQKSNDGAIKVADLRKLLGCKNCKGTITGTLAITPDGEAWVGLSTGMLIIDQNGKWRIITPNEIMPRSKLPSGVRVLLSDAEGNMWISMRDALCLYSSAKWNCRLLDDLIMADIVVSATEGLSGQIWFGTFEGRIILWDGGEFRVLDFSGKDFKDIESLAFDRQRNILWALSLHFSQCDAVSDACPPKILQVGPDGSQMFHETEQFLVAGQSTCNPPAFTSIAVTPDGKVWVGMMFCHNLVSYNGKVWETVTSRTLPLSDTDWATVEQGGSCSLGGYIANVFATKDGRLLIANQAGYVLEAKAEVLR